MIYQDSCISFGEDDKEALRNLVRRVLRPGCRIVEIGSWLGAGSTRVIIEELKTVEGGMLYCVDTWKGSVNVTHHQDVTARYDVFETFLHNVKLVGGEAYVHPYVMNSREAAAIIEDGSMDLVFIDGDHSYSRATEDIALWRHKVREGGILCGHDCECRPDSILCDTIASYPDIDHISGAGTPFEVIHLGVVAAVEQAFNGAAHLWAETPFLKADGSFVRATLWDIQLPEAAVEGAAATGEGVEALPLFAGSVSGFNIVRFADIYYAVQEAQGPMDLRQMDVSALPQGILTGLSYDEVLLAIASVVEGNFVQERLGGVKEQQPALNVNALPRLVGSVSGYNIVLFEDIYYAVPQSHGPMDLSQLEPSAMPEGILAGSSYNEALLAVESNIARKAQEQVESILAQQESVKTHSNKTDKLLHELLLNIDIEIAELKTISEQLQKIKWPQQTESGMAAPHLVGSASDYNIVVFKGVYYAVPQSLGPIDLSQQEPSVLPDEVLTGGSYNEVLLAIASITEPESTEECLDSAKQRLELVGVCESRADQWFDALLDSINAEIAELIAIKEQLGKISNNPLIKIGRLMTRVSFENGANNS